MANKLGTISLQTRSSDGRDGDRIIADLHLLVLTEMSRHADAKWCNHFTDPKLAEKHRFGESTAKRLTDYQPANPEVASLKKLVMRRSPRVFATGCREDRKLAWITRSRRRHSTCRLLDIYPGYAGTRAFEYSFLVAPQYVFIGSAAEMSKEGSPLAMERVLLPIGLACSFVSRSAWPTLIPFVPEV